MKPENDNVIKITKIALICFLFLGVAFFTESLVDVLFLLVFIFGVDLISAAIILISLKCMVFILFSPIHIAMTIDKNLHK